MIDTRIKLMRWLRIVAHPEGEIAYSTFRACDFASPPDEINAALNGLIKSGRIVDTGKGYKIVK